MRKKHRYFFSVIIPTYNRKDEIQELLESLENQSLSKDLFEVILVDDGSTDGTEEWVRTFEKRSSLRLVYLQQERQGPGVARNKGMESGLGEVFVFIDSDCIAPPDWLEGIHRAFEEDPSIQAFGGRDDARSDFSPLLKAINYTMTSFLTTGGMRGGKRKRLAKFYPRSFNMGLHRELYDRIGGFGNLRHGQDIAFSHRILRGGAKVAYLPDSVVYHKRRMVLRGFFRQVFNWGVARVNLSRIDSDMLEPLHFVPALGLWFSLLFTLIAFLSRTLFPVWLLFLLVVGVLLFGSGIHAGLKWRSLSTGILVPVVAVFQITGYGLGFTSAFIWRVLLSRGEFTGFVRRYYQ